MTEQVILVTGGYDHHVRFWEASSAMSSQTIQYNDSQINSLVISPDRRYLAVAGVKNVKLYDITRSQASSSQSLEKPGANFVAFEFQKEGKWMFSGSQDGVIRIWDRRSKTPHYEYNTDGKSPVNCAILHPNQVEIIAGYQDGFIRVWDLKAGKMRVEVQPELKATPIRSLSLAQDASLFVCSNDRGAFYVYESSADEENIVDQNDTDWELKRTGKIIAHNNYCLKTVLSADCQCLATTSADKTIKLWECKNNFALRKTLTGHQRWVWDACFSADSLYLVSVSTDCTAKLWDCTTGSTVLEYQGHTKGLCAVALADNPE